MYPSLSKFRQFVKTLLDSATLTLKQRLLINVLPRLDLVWAYIYMCACECVRASVPLTLSLLAVDQNGLSEVNKIGVPFVWLYPGQDLSCDEDRCLWPSEDGVRLPIWRGN